jgi:hypothetical protein
MVTDLQIEAGSRDECLHRWETERESEDKWEEDQNNEEVSSRPCATWVGTATVVSRWEINCNFKLLKGGQGKLWVKLSFKKPFHVISFYQWCFGALWFYRRYLHIWISPRAKIKDFIWKQRSVKRDLQMKVHHLFPLLLCSTELISLKRAIRFS